MKGNDMKHDEQGNMVDIPLRVSNFDVPYAKLYDNAAVSGYEVWTAYSHNNFDNPLARADQELYDKRNDYWAEVVKDKVSGRKQMKGEASPGEGFVPVTYETPSGKNYLWLPRKGLILPQKDERKGVVWFREGTLAPLETVPSDQRSLVEQRFSELGLPQEQISGFYRSDDFNDYRFVGRLFDPSCKNNGRFKVVAGWHPNDHTSEHTGVRSNYNARNKKGTELTLDEIKKATSKTFHMTSFDGLRTNRDEYLHYVNIADLKFPDNRTDVCAVVVSREDGYSYGYDSLYLVWRDGEQVKSEGLDNTRSTKDPLRIYEVEDMIDHIHIEYASSGLYSGKSSKRQRNILKEGMNIELNIE